MNAIKFEEEFGVKKKEITSTNPSETKKEEISNSIPSLLLPARQQNINIVLNKLRKSVVDIIEGLILYDETILKISVCELLL